MKTILILGTFFALLFMSCNNKSDESMEDNEGIQTNSEIQDIELKLKKYVPTKITADISHLTERQKMLVKLLAEAGHYADEIFWKQTAPCAVATRDSLKAIVNDENRAVLDFVMINYGPYDQIAEDERFIGNGPEKRPAGGAFYPIDLTKDEFEKYLKDHPEQAEELQGQYSVVVRDGDLKAIPYHDYYPEVKLLSEKLLEASEYADNPGLKNYLVLRSKAVMTDDYFESDMAWMDIKGNDIDIVIGPIENYEDAMYNYRTAYEAVIMIKDPEASKELDMFNENISQFQNKLPYTNKKFISPVAKSGNILQVVNVAYFGGDCQRGVKTIAAALPNDPRVHEKKGGKKSMYKNLMEAKFDHIVMPIAEKLLSKDLIPWVNKKAFTSFVTLHEVSHTLGRGYVFGNKNLTVRKALKERYSAVEECKADILGMYNHKHLLDLGLIDNDYMNKARATYLAGLYRSIRFGMESAHGQANLIQLNFLREKGAIYKENNLMKINDELFFKAVGELADLVLTLQATGDYDGVGNMFDKYKIVSEELKSELELLNDLPVDLNTSYDY